MNIHEHQAKAVLKEFGVAVPRGYAAFSPDEALKAAKTLASEAGSKVFVVKSQIHAGGRGKGRFEGLGPDAKGGVRVVKSPEDVKANADEMLGRVLVTHQTGPAGKQVNRLYIEEGADIAKELYLSLLVDRVSSKVSVVASTEGGMDIEDVAHNTPEKIHTFTIDPATGVWPTHTRALAKALNSARRGRRRFPGPDRLRQPCIRWPRRQSGGAAAGQAGRSGALCRPVVRNRPL